MRSSEFHVLIDATAVPSDRGGVGRYVDSLVPALVQTGLSVSVACRVGQVSTYARFGAEPVSVSERVASAAPRLAWEQVGLPALLNRVKPDVLHSPHYTMPLARPLVRKIASVVTLHDATFFTDPGLHSKTKGPFFRAATRFALRAADIAVVPSQATAEELRRVAGADTSRLQVAHHGVDSAIFRPPIPTEVAAVRTRLGLADGLDYVAFLGTLEPRKNLPELVRAFAEFAPRWPTPLALVLAGGKGWDEELDGVIAALPPTVRVVRPGYLPLECLPGLLGGAAVVAYPSLGEGFGLPVLEAMACGAAVLTTERLALPEVGGDAVAYCDVTASSIATGLRDMLSSPERTTELRAAAVARAAKFTWLACAQQHRQAYERAVSRRTARR